MLLSKEEFIYLVLVVSVSILTLLVFFLFALILNVRIRKQKAIELLSANITTQEKERQRIAEDLHDDLGPALSALKLQVNHITDSDDLEYDSKNIASQLDTIIANVRYVSKNLSSSSIKSKGFLQSVKDLKYIMDKSGTIRFNFNSDELPPDLSEFSLSTIYRIIQEMITNSVRHSTANQLNLSLEIRKQYFNLIYEDNGKPVIHDKESKAGFGLTNIKNRSELLKGWFILKPDFKTSNKYYIRFKIENLT
ncbi:MAG TPA: histidine kinase [Bacteroidia bacterium]|nr:histidine kinase [Bacteroidia bacterium]